MRESVFTQWVERLEEGSKACGSMQTAIPGVRLFWANQTTDPVPFLNNSGIVLVFQGRKIGYLADREFTYDADNYLVLGIPMPFECATYASTEQPLVGLYVDVERNELRELVALIEANSAKVAVTDAKTASSIEPARLDEAMRRAGDRLFQILDDPLECAVMGAAARRDVVFRALSGPRANTLTSLVRFASADERIDRAMTMLRKNFVTTIGVEDLAAEANMSTSAFHRAFKQKSGYSPIQYLKYIRLHYARRLLFFETAKVGVIARKVGYESVSQFSREYRRLFGEAPSAARKNTTRLPSSVSDSMDFDLPLADHDRSRNSDTGGRTPIML